MNFYSINKWTIFKHNLLSKMLAFVARLAVQCNEESEDAFGVSRVLGIITA